MPHDVMTVPQQPMPADPEGETTEPPGSDAAPPPIAIAELVRAHRRLRGWKQEVLAQMAGVSLSSVERVERGDAVSQETLDQVAIALEFKEGDFWKPRHRLSPAEAMDKTMAWLDGKLIVPCRVFTTVSDAAEAIAAVATYVVVQGDQPDERTEVLVAALREWLGLLSFATSDLLEPKMRIRPRKAQRQLLDVVEAVARRGYTPLLATYVARTPWGSGPVAAISFHPRISDPGASKRRELVVPAVITADEIDWG